MSQPSASAPTAGSIDSLRQTYDVLSRLIQNRNSCLQQIARLSARTDQLCSVFGDLGSGAMFDSIAALRADLVALKDQYDVVEPFAHVEAVERLRQQNRPEQVKLLLIAESHVRVSGDQFDRRGCGFIYEPRYTTPWWRDLFLPAFGSKHKGRLTPELKARMLERMRSAGFWVLDASILSLSGYQKVAPVENRPFSRAPYTRGLEREIPELSWRDHVDATFSSVMSSPNPPVLAAYRRIAICCRRNGEVAPSR